MDATLRWYASLVHGKHALKSGEDHWADCSYWPCHLLQVSVLKGTPELFTESDGAGTY